MNTSPSYSLDTLINEYSKHHFYKKSKKEFVTDSDVRKTISRHPLVYGILRGFKAW